MVLIAVGVFFTLTFFQFSGIFGQAISKFLFGLTGMFAYVLPAVLIIYGIYSIALAGTGRLSSKSLLAAGLSLCLTAIMHAGVSGQIGVGPFLEFIVQSFDAGEMSKAGGGLFGALLSYPMLVLFGEAGTYIIYSTFMLVQLIALTNLSLKRTGERVKQVIQDNAAVISEQMAVHKEERMKERAEREQKRALDLDVIDLSKQQAPDRSKKILPENTGFMELEARKPVNSGEPELFPDTGELLRRKYDLEGVSPLEEIKPIGDLPPSRFTSFVNADLSALDEMSAKSGETGEKPEIDYYKAFGIEPAHHKKAAPEAVIEELDAANSKPDTASLEHNDESPELDGAIQEPDVMIPEPDAAGSEPDVANSEPDIISPELDLTLLELDAGEYERFLPPLPGGVYEAQPRPEPKKAPAPLPYTRQAKPAKQPVSQPQPASRLQPVQPEQLQPEPQYAQPSSRPQHVQPVSEPEPRKAPEPRPAPRHVGAYVPPPAELLKLPPVRQGAKEDTAHMAQILEETLQSFGITAHVCDVSQGPTITRYELQPAPGVRVNRITNLSDDIALNLAAPRVRIEAPIPGKAAVGIEVPNKETVPVLLREMIDSREFKAHKSKLCVALGKDIAGKTVLADIAKMPHLLIAGSTGSGKSVCINCIICSLVYHSAPDEVKLIMVDPKVVELAAFANIPHLLIPVVTEPKKAAGALKWGVQEMIKRYNNFAKVGARDLARYNEITMEQGARRTPQIVVIVDELADLMMVAPDDVEDAICRIAQMGRAAGIHLVVATQRPSADVITGLIKANVPSRIAFAVASGTDSRIILDSGGAEKLLGKGDMLFSPLGASKPTRAQGAFVSDTEVEAIHDYFELNKFDVEQMDEAQIASVEAGGESDSAGGGEDGEYEDELLPKAVEVLMSSGTASISMIQRRLRVGYARAARLIDIMETMGIVSGFEGSKPRKLLIDRAGFERIFGKPPELTDIGT